ncbi:hypothetical protein SJAG_03749 [Schizosaccharomyces japonicus yFS275]|uniref:Uncharacterized protein n=1 Tax=Schizosaccharomyces japonicus (strain yFS275 / FY16936) TaxID=402676 RepID=B6K2U9_SCHJY|nr:hypothetical protein SJAG_03749 [Schizosaccharomyces japonicus yFS275]EEB08589.1 hypothetical protein SJAG_03749 [Schizosaccharomyces japonicus yFS275]
MRTSLVSYTLVLSTIVGSVYGRSHATATTSGVLVATSGCYCAQITVDKHKIGVASISFTRNHTDPFAYFIYGPSSDSDNSNDVCNVDNKSYGDYSVGSNSKYWDVSNSLRAPAQHNDASYQAALRTNGNYCIGVRPLAPSHNNFSVRLNLAEIASAASKPLGVRVLFAMCFLLAILWAVH